MNEQRQPRPDDQEPQTRSFLPVTADQFAPTQQFPAVDYSAERFPARYADDRPGPARAHCEPERPTERFYESEVPAERTFGPRRESVHYPEPQFAAHPLAAPLEPLAHEGGFAYGNLPAAPYGPMDPYIPQHLHVPQPLAYGQFNPQFGYPPRMQQMVVVNGTGRGARRVNHALHLILTMVTFGLWLPVWVILAIANS